LRRGDRRGAPTRDVRVARIEFERLLQTVFPENIELLLDLARRLSR